MSEQTETLRRAAASMRENAGQATGAPWVGLANGTVRGVGDNRVADMVPSWNLRHIASWHPAVALAVADWLEQEADDLDSDPDAPTYDEADLHPCMQRAIKAARAYLGESA